MTIQYYAEKYGFDTSDCGWRGKAFEVGTKDFLGSKNPRVSPAGRADYRRANRYYEFKHSGGELGILGDKLIKGSSLICYAPIVHGNDELQSIRAYVMPRDTFLAVLDSVGLLREKTSTNGIRKVTIQTFWNNKLDEPHGKKYFKLVDALNICVSVGKAMTFADWLKNGWTL